MSYEVETQNLDTRHALSIRATSTPQELGQILAQLLPEVWQYAKQNGVEITGPPFTRYYEAGPDSLEIEAGIPVARPALGNGRILASQLPGGPVAVTVHVGPYEKLREAHAAIEKWMHASGKRAGGAPWESYVTDPGEEPDPNKWQTQIFQPL